MNKFKILIAIHPSPFALKLIKFGKELSRVQNSDCLAVYVKGKKKITGIEKNLFFQIEILTKELGIELIVLDSDDVFQSIMTFCIQNEFKHIIMGKPQRPLNYFLFYKEYWLNFKNRQNKLDVTFLTPDENLQLDDETKDLLKSLKLPHSFYFLKQFPLSITATVILTILNLLLNDLVDYRSLGMIYILGINIFSFYSSKISILITTFLCSIAWNFLFIPPRFTLHIYSKDDWMMELMFISVSLIIGYFINKLKNNEHFLIQEGKRKSNLYRLLKNLSSAIDINDFLNLANKSLEQLLDVKVIFKIRKGILQNILHEDSSISKAKYDLRHNDEFFGHIQLDTNDINDLDLEKKLYLEFIASQVVNAIVREKLYLENTQSRLELESQKIGRTILSSISHELRTPLSAIKGYASVLSSYDLNQNQHSKNSFVKEAGIEIYKGVVRLDDLVQKLLDMSRIEMGIFKIKNELVEVIEVVNAACNKVQVLFPERKIILNQPNFPLYTMGDFILLQQVFENVIANACSYSSEDVLIYFPEKRHNIISIDVIDRGIGIIDTQKIFDKFYRERPEIPGGTGLGLAICKNYIELHRGRITAFRLSQGGSQFTIELPKENLIEPII